MGEATEIGDGRILNYRRDHAEWLLAMVTGEGLLLVV